MLSITQFEVYVLDRGRWTIHARYGSDQRKAAIMDARETEFSIGVPTKVVSETYFPEIDEAELVTVYVSPKARELREAAKVRRSGGGPVTARRAAAVPSAPKQRAASPRGGGGIRRQLLQAFVAGAFSLVAATISTVLISWVLRRSIDAGLPVSPHSSTTILTYTYAVFFIFFFTSLLRSKLPLHRLIAYLWTQPEATQEKAEATAKSIAAAIAPKLRPKQPPAIAEAEAARALEQLKILRGDPKPEPEPAAAPEPPPPAPAPPELPPPVEVLSDKEKKRREKKQKEAEERAAAAKSAAEDAQTAKAQSAAQTVETASRPAGTEVPNSAALPLESAVLRRFVAEVVSPATADTMPDDPVTRRGVCLVIAGAADALAESVRTPPERRRELVADALASFGIPEASVASFLHLYDELAATPANASLVSLGRSALARHLEGADVVRTLAAAIAGWRTPFGQPAGMATASTASAPAAPLPETAPQDIYLLTELRIGPAYALTPDGAQDMAAEAARDAAMGLHNSVVRSVLGTHAGHEVKHTGTGIFAQFGNAAAALAAASEIQRRFTSTQGPKLSVALIASTGEHDDPTLTPNLVRQAQTAAAQACDGEILAERRVQRAAIPAEQRPAIEAEDEDDAALVKIVTGEEAEEPALYEHIPAGTPAPAQVERI